MHSNQQIKNNAFNKNELDLKVLRPNRYLSLSGPKMLGCFSCYRSDKNVDVYCPNKSSLRYLDLTEPVSLDCLQGFDPNVKYGHLSIGDMHLLRWVLNNESTIQTFPMDFICYNGFAKDLIVAPFTQADWNITAVKVRGTIIINRSESNQRKTSVDVQSEFDSKSTYTALNLERLITKNINDHEYASVNARDSFFGVFHSKIGRHQILHTGRLNCVESKEELDKPFEEMNFNIIKKVHGNKRTGPSRSKALLWWSLAILSRVETIICGRCTEDFTVNKIIRIKVDELVPRHMQTKCFTSMDAILDFVKSKVKEENKYYNFAFDSMAKKVNCYLKLGSKENSIPSWYMDGQFPLEP
uniref:Decapping nuclease n=1 Tax=Tetranychus urticae TaxID=32264 RepID=T1KUC6_TETUR